MDKKGEKVLILVLGAMGSGKTTFAHFFRNAFLQGYPDKDLQDGILEDRSFAYETSLLLPKEIELVIRAKKKGFKINAYFILSSKNLNVVRCRFRSIISGEKFDEAMIKKSYETTYKNISAIFPDLDLLFLVRNLKAFEFVAAYEPGLSGVSSFLNDLRALKSEADRLS